MRQYEKPVEINHDRIVCAHLIACGRIGDLVPATDTEADSETTTSSTY